jgi:hypothetical protein
MELPTRLPLQQVTQQRHQLHQVRQLQQHHIQQLKELPPKQLRQALDLYGLRALRQPAIGCLLNTEMDCS